MNPKRYYFIFKTSKGMQEVSISAKEIMDIFNVANSLEPTNNINQIWYDLFVILNGKAKGYFGQNLKDSDYINKFQGLPKELKKFFKLAVNDKLLSIGYKIKNSQIELFRNHNKYESNLI